jgi:hypothetical protein
MSNNVKKKKQSCIEGLLICVPLNVGSKSEHNGFVIRKNDGSEIKIYLKGDNPFENKLLQPLKDKYVRALGELYKVPERFVAETVVEVK